MLTGSLIWALFLGSMLFRKTIKPKFLLVFFLSGLFLTDYAAELPVAKPILPPPPAVNVILPDSVISIKNMATQQDSAKINEIIAIKLYTSKNIDSLKTLYINGLPIKAISPYKTNNIDKVIYFKLNNSVQDTILTYLSNNSFEKSVVPLYFGVGNKVQQIAQAKTQLYVEVRQKISKGWVVAILALMAILVIVALLKNVLKDDNNLYYSLGRTQLLYWTVLVVIAYLDICYQTGVLPDISNSILAILGISVTTTAFTKVVENHNKVGVIIDEHAKSEGWFLDILSDGSSINIQRFQNVVFNLFFGVIFLQKAFSTHLMPDFDNNVLLLLGISSGTYAGLKITEATKEQNKPAPQVGTDIPAAADTSSSATASTTTAVAGNAQPGAPQAEDAS